MANAPSCVGRVAVMAIFAWMISTAAAQPPKSNPAEQPSQGARSMTKPIAFKLAKPEKPLILLEVRVNDRGPFHFVLDTGAGMTIITPELADKLEVRRDEANDQAVGAGGRVQVQFGTLKSIAVGETRLEELKVGIMDLQIISKACETDLDGIVGYNFLKDFQVLIDYPNQTVTFRQ